MFYFCTYFDQNYLPRGMALYCSLQEHCPSFKLWVLCMDEVTHRTLAQLNLPGVEIIAQAAFEHGDAALLTAKQNRSTVEYYFTCTPSLPLFILQQDVSIDLITYLDADLYFFADPAPLFEELGTGSIAITAHRFSPELIHLERYGRYNVGWLTFRRDSRGMECLHWWRARCIEWCYDRIEGERFADQKYLNVWPERFEGTVVLSHIGANLAPWNLANYRITHRRSGIFVNAQPLIFFHFHGFRQINRWLYDHNLDEYKMRPPRPLLQMLYVPYIRELLSLQKLGGNLERNRTKRFWMPELLRRIGRIVHATKRLIQLKTMVFYHDHLII